MGEGARDQRAAEGDGARDLVTRPRVVVFSVVSLDGRIAYPDQLWPLGDERWRAIAGSDATDVLALHDADVVLEGSNSFVTRGASGAEFGPAPEGVDIHSDYLPKTVIGRFKHFYAVVDGRGRVRWRYKVGPEGESPQRHLLIVTCRATPAAYLAFLRDQEIPYMVAGEEGVDLGASLQRLHEVLGVRAVVCCSAGLLGGALLRARLVDEIDLEFVPAVIGGSGAPTLFEGPDLVASDRPMLLRPLEVDPKPDGRVFVRYAVKGPA